MNKKLHILCATDDNYAQHCGVMICSICQNHKDNNLCFHIIENELSEESRSKIRKIINTYNQEIIYHRICPVYFSDFKLGNKTYTSPSVYYRLFVTRLITDSSIEKILYLDCDIVVLKDIAPLFNIDMSDYTIAAVGDINQPMYEEQAFQISFSYNDKYFNSGVLMINLINWRKNNIEKQLKEFCIKERKVFFPDQDALNKVFRGKWLELPPYWNRFNLVHYEKLYFKNKRDLLDYIYNPSLIHYASPTARPWMSLKYIPFANEYNFYLSQTPWKDSPKEHVTKYNRYKSMMQVRWANFLYRNPLLTRILLTSLFDCTLIIFHIIKHRSLKYYSPYKIK